MFEQSVIQARALAARPWTMAVSLAGQCTMVGLAILIPLVHPDVLPGKLWIPLEPPPRYRAPEPVKNLTHTVATRPVVRPGVVFVPQSIPSTVAILVDPPSDLPPAASGSSDGVPGGLGLAGEGSPIIRSLARDLPPIAPPPEAPVVKPLPPKPAPVTQPIRVGGDVQAARLISGPQPVYPPLARQARISGVVMLAAVIGKDGRIQDLRMIAGHPLLVPAAIDAVKRWVWRPTLLNGEPVEVATEITVKFILQ